MQTTWIEVGDFNLLKVQDQQYMRNEGFEAMSSCLRLELPPFEGC